MQARTSTLNHKASGLQLETPLLVPAFSSKGFAIKDGVSEIRAILSVTEQWLTSSYLISAYDITYGHIPAARDLAIKPEFIILDSGGYEVARDHDMSATRVSETPTSVWTADMLGAVLESWPTEMPAIFVSYDHPGERKVVEEQIRGAKSLFKGHSGQLHCFLLKPESQTQETLRDALRALKSHAEDLRAFDIIGITEKELAGSTIDRMVQIARLRQMLDDAAVDAPIHVFGALDPMTACLYFLAGAEIFDGLTWLRYAFSDRDQCVYVHNHADLKYGISFGDDPKVRARVWVENIYYLNDLQVRLKDFLFTENFAALPHGLEVMKPADETLRRRLARGGG